MGTFAQIRVALTGFVGGPGVMTFYAEEPQQAIADLHTFLVGIKVMIPNEVTMTIEPGGNTIEEDTGAVAGGWVATTPPEGVAGENAGTYSAPSGVLVHWLTTGVADGHRIKGRTFLVPAGAVYDSFGQVAEDLWATISSQAELIPTSAGGFQVWHRPREARAAVTGGLKALTAHAGVMFPITGSGVSRKPVVLRSRRD